MTEAKNAINEYRCPTCNWKAITKTLVDGVTPMFIRCEGPKLCDRNTLPAAVSMMYRVNQAQQPTHEWYRPEGEELEKAVPSVKDHVEAGGLLLRRLTPEGRTAKTLTPEMVDTIVALVKQQLDAALAMGQPVSTTMGIGMRDSENGQAPVPDGSWHIAIVGVRRIN